MFLSRRMEPFSFLILLLLTLSRVSVAYKTWTLTHYWETYTYWISTDPQPCTVETDSLFETDSYVYLSHTYCPTFVSWQYGKIDVTPTAPVQGYSTTAYTSSMQFDTEWVTVVDLYIELTPNQLPSPTTTAVEPSRNGYGYVFPNGTIIELMQQVLFTAPASCTPGVIITWAETFTQSDYSFTSTVPIDILDTGLLPQVMALATSTAVVLPTLSSTMTTVQYYIPPDTFPYQTPGEIYGPDYCIDPRATETTATPTTISSQGNGKKGFTYQGAYMTAIPAAVAAAGLLL